ncbi:MAG: hypothetical protein PF486_00835 [Prolixibacteraceae bacterium]|jgi:hypothetical protein|nr:hypothetical protein [Prolixibacteraceae bacterium]
MKKKIVYSFLFVFALAVFAPTVVNAIDTDVQIVKVEGDEKKKADCDKKAETKSADCDKKTEKKSADCDKKAKSSCAEKKSSCSEKKAECDKE